MAGGGRGKAATVRRRRPGRTLLGVIAGILGAVGAIALLDLVWAPADRGLSLAEQNGSGAGLGDPPTRPITVLLIGSDADRINADRNGAAPPGPANGDAVLLLRADPAGTLQVLSLPTELAVRLPGSQAPQALGSLYRQGGPALTATAVAELVGLDPGLPERYLVLPRGALREFIDGLGGVEISLDKAMRYEDRAQNYRIDLQGGLQLLKGAQVEQLVRFREPGQGEEARRQRQQQLVGALVLQLARSDQWPGLPDRLRGLEGRVDTNLSQAEALSLLAAAVKQPQAIRYDKIPLAATAKADQPLRALDPSAQRPLWPRS